MTTGALIREAREAEGLTQAALARRLGITQPSIARLEAAGDEVTVATLQRALNAMGRALVLQVVPQKSSIDETLLYETLRLTPDERLTRFESWYAGVRELAPDGAWPEFHPRALLKALAESGLDLVVVGGLAAVLHGSAASTRDVDIAYAPDSNNTERLDDVLDELGARPRASRAPDGRSLPLATPEGWISLVTTSEYQRLHERAWRAPVAGVELLVASLDDLIAMKKAAGRPKDLVAVEELEAIKRLQRERS